VLNRPTTYVFPARVRVAVLIKEFFQAAHHGVLAAPATSHCATLVPYKISPKRLRPPYLNFMRAELDDPESRRAVDRNGDADRYG
jgi:hypothetical protein